MSETKPCEMGFDVPPPATPPVAVPPTSFSNTNLPVYSMSFIGRKADIFRLQSLAATNRVITIVGEPGIGKTRIAVEIGLRQLVNHEDGVWFVQLDSMLDSSQVHLSVAQVFEIEAEPGRPIEDTLAEHLRDKDLLLILDHCDRARASAGNLIRHLLSQCPRIKVLVTCREAIGVEAERDYSVPAMRIPTVVADSQGMIPAYSLFQFESSRLFIERARLCKPDFELPSTSVAALCQLCLQLNGNPLAIELAAARAHSLAIDQLLEFLASRTVPDGQSRHSDGLRRHGLECVIDWTYGLLTEKERIVLRRLSVFAGGWEMEEAEQICSDSYDAARENPEARILPGEVASLTQSLVLRSLVFRVQTCESTRYAMSPPVLSFVAERRIQTSDDTNLRARHRAYYSSLAQQSANATVHPEQSEDSHQLSQDASYSRTVLNDIWVKGIRIALAAPAGADALVLRRQTSHDLVSAEALDLMSRSALDRKDLAAAREYLGASLDLWRRLGDDRRAAALCECMASLTFQQN